MLDHNPDDMTSKDWLGLLARAPNGRAAELFASLNLSDDAHRLRRPEIGSVMVRGRAGGTGAPFNLGEMTVTRCGLKLPTGGMGHGYVLVFAQSERKAISMALVDRSLRWEELGEDNVGSPAQDADCVLYHGDNIQATGFSRTYQAAALR